MQASSLQPTRVILVQRLRAWTGPVQVAGATVFDIGIRGSEQIGTDISTFHERKAVPLRDGRGYERFVTDRGVPNTPWSS